MNRPQMAPSILAADFNRLGEQLRVIEDCGVSYLHIDVMDGLFVPQISMGMPVIESIRKESGMVFDVHLMIVDPIRYIQTFADCGADIITFHVEAAEDPETVIAAIRKAGKKVGISVKPGTPVEAVRQYIPEIDQMLVMTVEPGFGGQKYIPEMTDKIRAAREMIRACGADCDVEVDGGIKKETIGTALEAGANLFVAGSAIFRGDLRENLAYYEEFLAQA